MEKLRRAVEGLPIDPTYEDWFRRRNRVRTIRGTTRIEGYTLDDEEVEEVLVEGPSENISRRDRLEIVNTRKATALADDIAGRGVPIDETVIWEVHRLVLADIAGLHRPGEYPRGENRVTKEDGNLILSDPVSGDVPERMHRFGAWLRDGCDGRRAPIAAAPAHLELVAIHPFHDGSGRTSRLLARILLRRAGYDFGNIVSLDAQLDTDRANYFKAVRTAAGRTYSRGYDATPFVAYFVSAITASIRYTLDRISGFDRVLTLLRAEAAARKIPAVTVEPLAYTWVNRTIRPSRYREPAQRRPGRTPGAIDRAIPALKACAELEQRPGLLGEAGQARRDPATQVGGGKPPGKGAGSRSRPPSPSPPPGRPG